MYTAVQAHVKVLALFSTIAGPIRLRVMAGAGFGFNH